MLETELYSSRMISPFRDGSCNEELSVLPRHTKVIVGGNNRTKSVLVGLQGVVKKAVGLGGWHWLKTGDLLWEKANGKEFHKLTKRRVRSKHVPVAKSTSSSSSRDAQLIDDTPRLTSNVNFAALGIESLRKYCRGHNLEGIHSDSTRHEMVNAAEQHYALLGTTLDLDEIQIIREFVQAVIRRSRDERLRE